MNKEKKVFYIDGIEWQHELGFTTVEFFETKKELLENKTHIKKGGCGIVKVEMIGTWVKKQNIWSFK